jgi:hypothetical protein
LERNGDATIKKTRRRQGNTMKIIHVKIDLCDKDEN